MFNITKYISVICHKKRLSYRNYLILTDARKRFDTINIIMIFESLNKVEREGNSLKSFILIVLGTVDLEFHYPIPVCLPIIRYRQGYWVVFLP